MPGMSSLNWRHVGDVRRGAGPSPALARIRRIVPSTGSMAQAEQLTLDPAVSPPPVLPGQLYDQIADLL